MKAVALLLCFLTILIGLLNVSNAYATKVNIVQVSYPNTVTASTSGTIDIKIHLTAYFGATPQYGQYGVLAAELVDSDHKDAPISGYDVTVNGQPAACNPPSYQPSSGPPITNCATMATSPQMDETIEFTFSNSHLPASQVWHLTIDAVALDGTGGQSIATSNFTISIT